jgi:5-methyltetrahydropteroyltriglutamate--homocysteine methyltransferase
LCRKSRNKKTPGEDKKMTHGLNRITTTHAGALPRSDALTETVYAQASGAPTDEVDMKARIAEETRQVVRRQLECGVDCINDGEIGKSNFTAYAQQRLAGFELRPDDQRPEGYPLSIIARDRQRFANYFDKTGGWVVQVAPNNVVVEDLKYVGQAAVAEDIANFQAALDGLSPQESYLPSVTPGSIEHWLANEHYGSTEDFVFAIAEAMGEEYEAIADAGFLLQVDDPDLPDGWQMHPGMSIEDYRKYADMRVAALNHGLRNIARDKIRLHVCWGSNHGPHQNDIGLEHIADLIFKVKAGSYSFEASNPMHEHEWRVFEDFKPPEGAYIVPGVVGHCTDFIEHPDLIAERLCRYADLVGRDNVMAGTDCGLGPRVGEAEIAWAKLEAMTRGAEIATKRLWG